MSEDTKQEIAKAAADAVKVVADAASAEVRKLAEAAHEAREVLIDNALRNGYRNPDNIDDPDAHLSVAQRFACLKKDIMDTLKIGLTVIGLIVAGEGVFIGITLNAQHESMKDRNEIHRSLDEVRSDFGTVLLISPAEHKKGYEWIYDKMTEKYNPTRGITK